MSIDPTVAGQLPRHELLALAHEYMLAGLIGVKATTPTVGLRSGLDDDAITALAIDQWMGASPIYTARTRALMGIEGDDIAAIMKALQLDVGFVHQYMDVAYQIDDERHGQFWLRHCGALIDVEPFGEAQVFSMCHTIEDPTFDATALATNPRARIRPIHRPPRTPADRHPHCHWTITIDPSADPVGPIPLNARVGALALAAVANTIPPGAPSAPSAPGAGLRHDYRGPFDPELRLRHFDDAALGAVAREFLLQTHLLVASLELALGSRIGHDLVRAIIDESWLAAAWVAGERLARVRGLGADADGLAQALSLTPMLPPGFTRSTTVEGNRLTCRLEAQADGLLDAGHPGWVGALARGVTTGFVGTAGGLRLDVNDVELSVDGAAVVAALTIQPADAAAAEPDVVAFARIGRAATWQFDDR